MVFVISLITVLLAGPIVWGCRNWIKYKGSSAPEKRTPYATLINSAVLYALAFNLIFFLQELFLVLGKKALGLRAFLYHNNHNWVGEHPLTSLMQGSGAAAIFLIGLICLLLYRLIPYSKSFWKLFALWLAFHGLLQSIPQVMVAYFDPNTDVGEALVGYLNLSQPLLMIMAIISITAIVVISIWFSHQLLEFIHGDVDLNNPKAKLEYIRFIAVGAGILGSILVAPFRIPPMSQAVTPFIVLVFSIPWIWAAAAMSDPVAHKSNRINEKIYWCPVVFLVLLFIFFRMVLAPGLEF